MSQAYRGPQKILLCIDDSTAILKYERLVDAAVLKTEARTLDRSFYR